MISWTVACQVPLFLGFSRKEFWSELPFPSPGNDRAQTWVSCIAGGFFNTWASWEAPFFCISSVQFSSIAQSCPTLCNPWISDARPPCASPTSGVHSNSCPSSWWCLSAISSSVVPFSSCPQSLPASGSFPMSQLFLWGGQSIGVLASAQSFQWTLRSDLL